MMKLIKSGLLTWICLVAVSIVSCANGEQNNQANDSKNGAVNMQEVTAKNQVAGNDNVSKQNSSKTQANPKLKYFYNIDKSNGMVTERIPFPANWQQHSTGEFAFTGPNGIKVYGEGGQYYSYSNDPTYMQLYQATGTKVKYPLTMDQTIEEIFMPIAAPLNRKLVKKYPIPQLLEGYKNFEASLYKIEQNPKQFDATALEWVDPDGTRWITVLYYIIEQGQNKIFWGFNAGGMGAPAKYFEEAKQDYLNGLLNKQINPQWLSAMNKQTEFTIRKSNEAHAQREAEFKRGVAERQQQWEANQEVIARRQEHIADVILGQTNIVDPNTGERTKINHTNYHYWVNSKGEYVGTDQSYDDPNKNSFLNNETWREFKIDDYR